MPLYDLEPGTLVDTGDRLLDEAELEQARERHAAGHKLAKIAADLGARPYSAPERRHGPQVAIEWQALVDALGEEKATELLGDRNPPVGG